jgi:hypothetical protein
LADAVWTACRREAEAARAAVFSLTAEFAAADVVAWALAAEPGHVAIIDELGCIERGEDAHSVLWTGRAREPEPLQLGDALLRIQEGLALVL